jgi:alpha-L-rhamnosidase
MLTGWLAASNLWASGMQPEKLRCELLENPLGIDAAQPRLSWILSSTARGQRQTAYEIQVASSAENLRPGRADFWDSGKVVSDQSAFIPYAGAPPASGQHCYWRVRVWDEDGKPSRFSANASFEMGLLKPDDWQAQWIGNTTDVDAKPAPMFRREFSLGGKIKQARAYLCGLGYGELRINGQQVGDRCLDPGYTRYDKRVLYVTLDITPLLKGGKNTVGVVLGNGWFNVQARAAWDLDEAPWRAAPRLRCSENTRRVLGNLIANVEARSNKLNYQALAFSFFSTLSLFSALAPLGLASAAPAFSASKRLPRFSECGFSSTGTSTTATDGVVLSIRTFKVPLTSRWRFNSTS